MKKMLAGALIVVAGLFLLEVPSVLAQGEPCTADFDCNGDVSATDVSVFLSQFGRSPFFNPCPDCYDSPCPCTAPGSVPKTGQTTSYATGDDGDLQKGLIWPNPRFTDNGDGTVSDNLTELIWLKDANCFSVRTWSNALSDSNGLADGSCGLTDASNIGDWRLPNLKELMSVFDLENYDPALPTTHPFINVETGGVYWSSSTDSSWDIRAHFVYPRTGGSGARFKTDTGIVWPVRDPL